MAIILDNDLIVVADAEITVQSTATGFAKANVFNFAHLRRRWRMNSAAKSNTNPVMYFNNNKLYGGTSPSGKLYEWNGTDAWVEKAPKLGAETHILSMAVASSRIMAIVLDDVNFDKAVIKGHATDLGTNWTTASFTTDTITIDKDAQTNRYKTFIPLTDFNYQYLAILVPTTAQAVGDYTGNWQIGRVGLLKTATEFSKNMSYGYQRGAQRAFREVSLESGHNERESTGPIQWTGSLQFGFRRIAQETDLTTLNNMDIGETLIFYENDEDTSKVYFCLRDDNYEGTIESTGIIKGKVIRLAERI